ncbi:MAG: SMP-30/gluconolactonase/LRE family protein, partial [Planctomycetes bacterium]|nr:SMP-30/gluconolactonase/LRE family protein [Planctomycetota bacterium]
MRWQALTTMTALSLIAAAAQKDPTTKDLAKVQGDWILVSAERDGQKVPDEEIKKTKLLLAGNKYKFLQEAGAGTSPEGTFKLDPTKNPKAIDSTPADGPDAGKTFQGIYEIAGDQQKVCFAPPGKERPTEFASKPGSGHIFQVWKREHPLPPTVAVSAELEVAHDEVDTLKRFFEGPSYDPKTDTLYFTAFAADGSQILKLDAAGKVSVYMDKTDGINGTFLGRRGGNAGTLLGCQGNKGRVVRVPIRPDSSAAELQVVAETFEGKKFTAPNDIAEDARGGFYFTDPDFNEKKSSAVYYVTPDGKVQRAVSDMQVPNGVYVGKGGRVLYVSDSAALHIRVYPVNPVSGEADQKQGRVFFDPPTENKNAPDGMTMDEHGNMYFAARGGVWVTDPGGRSLGLIGIPEFCSNCTFGGRDGRTLYMTCQNRVYKLAMNVRGWEFASRHEFTGQEPLKFKKTVLDTTFRSEGVAVADVNRDGKMDVLAGEVW